MKNNTTYTKTKLLQASLFTVALLGIYSCGNSPAAINAAGARSAAALDSTNKAKDAKFIVNAAEINLEEISLGQIAQQNSSMTDIKDMGKMMEDDHRKSWNEVSALAAKKSIVIPVGLNDNALADQKKLNGLSGPDFDKAYCDMMVSGHKDAIAMFEKASTEAHDTDIRQWAAATLPALHKHLDHATACQQECKKM